MAEHHRKKTLKRKYDVRRNALRHKWKNSENYEKTRNYEYKRAYGITLEQRDEIMKSNSGMCHICNQKPSEHIDHCHSTNTIRGALCPTCNWMLGHAHDDSKVLRAAAEYLDKFAS